MIGRCASGLAELDGIASLGNWRCTSYPLQWIRPGRVFIGWSAALPVGYSATLIYSRNVRAVEEDFSTGHGFNAGVVGSFLVGGPRHSFQVQAMYLLHWTSLTHTMSLRAPGTAVSEKWTMLEHVGAIGLAYSREL